MVRSNRSFIVFLIPLILLINCTNKPLYDRVDSIPSDGWETGNKLMFEFPITDTTLSYDILFHVRNLQNYSYSNIWLFIEIAAPNSFVKRDTFEIMLADDAGRWLGKGIGNINSMLTPYRIETTFPFRGIYKITLQHAMRDELLKNMLDVGIRVQQHQ